MTVKEQVLRALADTPGEDLSGSRLAARCGVTRNAIWKAVRALRAEGYRIEAATNRGYRLEMGEDALSPRQIHPFLTTRYVGRPLEALPVVDSTNRYCKDLAIRGAAHGTAVAADRQTGGRGRRGRQFYSPPGTGVYLSILLRPSDPAETVGLYTSCAAVAVAQAIEALAGFPVGIKWVNDLFMEGKKVCGILTEAAMDLESGGVEYAVIGMGINVAPMEFPEALREVATSVGNVCGKTISRNRLIAEILNRLEPALADCAGGGWLEESRRRSIVLGKQVTVYRGNEVFPAKAVDIDRQGRLVLETETGGLRLASGEVSIRCI